MVGCSGEGSPAQRPHEISYAGAAWRGGSRLLWILLALCAGSAWEAEALADVLARSSASVVIQESAAVTIVDNAPQLALVMVSAGAMGNAVVTLSGSAGTGGPASPADVLNGGGLGAALTGLTASGVLSGDAVSLDLGDDPQGDGASRSRVPHVVAQYN